MANKEIATLPTAAALTGAELIHVVQGGNSRKVAVSALGGGGGGVTLGTSVAATSGTSIDFTSIPSEATNIKIVLSGVSTTGTSVLGVQLGSSGGFATSGYLCSAGDIVGAAAAQFTTLFGTQQGGAGSHIRHGILELNKVDGDTWAFRGVLSISNAGQVYISAGSVTLPGALDRVRVTTVGGTDTFDGGDINISWDVGIVAASSLTVPKKADFSIDVGAALAATTDGAESLFFNSPVASAQVRALMKPLPGGDFSVVAQLDVMVAKDFNGAGIFFRDTDGRIVSLVNMNVAGNWCEVGNWTNATTFLGNAGNLDLDTMAFPRWLRCDFVAATSDVTGFISYDGEHWIQIGTSTHLATADAFGIGVSQRNAANKAYAYFKHFAVS